MEPYDLLENFSNASGISGHEDEVRALFVSSLQGCGRFYTDKTGSTICEHGDSGPRIMLAAHMDEIGFLIQNITPQGFLQIVPIGGWWTHTLPSQRVIITTRSGEKIRGVIGSKPPHLLPESQKKSLMTMEALFIDIGAESADQAIHEFGVHPGDPVTPDSTFTYLRNKGRVMGKAFDNRAGLAAMTAATLSLTRSGHPNILLATATVQEEVGIRGAKTATQAILPDCAIILEGPPADDTPGFAPSESQGKLGGGVQIRLYDPTAITNPRLARLVEETALNASIPYQLTVRRSGGTDAGAIHLSGQGVPCIVLGIPARYIHAHNGIMSLADFDAAIALCEALVRRLDAKAVASLTQYI